MSILDQNSACPPAVPCLQYPLNMQCLSEIEVEKKLKSKLFAS